MEPLVQAGFNRRNRNLPRFCKHPQRLMPELELFKLTVMELAILTVEMC